MHFESQMGNSFRVERRRVAVDGRVVLTEETPASQAFEADVPQGPHEVGVEIALRGEGSGVFSYLRGYKFQVR